MKALCLLVFSTLLACFPVRAEQWLWVDKPGSDKQDAIGNSSVEGVATSAIKGITYSTGYFTQKMTIQNIVLKAAFFQDAFVAKYDTDGKALWAFSMSASAGSRASSIALDTQENLYVVGTFSGKIYFDAMHSAQSLQNDSLFIAKYDSNGSFKWAQTGGSLSPSHVSVDADGNVLVVGSFKDQQNLGGVVLQSQGNFDVFVAKYKSSGTLIWAQSAGTVGNDSGEGITSDAYKDIYITGAMAKGLAQFGPQSVNNVNGNWRSVFVAKYKSTGTLEWARIETSVVPSDSNLSIGYAVTCDQSGYCYVTGSFNFNLLIQNKLLSANADKDIFLIKYAYNGKVKWIKSAGGSTSIANGDPLLNDDEALAITVDESIGEQYGRVLITGYFESDCTFDGQLLTNTGNKDIFVASYNKDTAKLNAVVKVGSNDIYSAAWGYGISADALGAIYVGGRFNTNSLPASAQFKPLFLTSNEGVYDAFVGKCVDLQ